MDDKKIRVRKIDGGTLCLMDVSVSVSVCVGVCVCVCVCVCVFWLRVSSRDLCFLSCLISQMGASVVEWRAEVDKI